MKNKLIILSILLVFTSTSCEKFLEEQPKGIISPDTFFASASDGKSAIAGIYAVLKNNALYGQLGLDAYYQNGADEVEPSRAFGNLGNICNYTVNEENAETIEQKMGVSSAWTDLYKVVLNANIIIQKVDGNAGISKVAQDDIIGEALFLRALAYYHLTNLWGNVPYYRTILKTDEIGQLPRTDANLIRNEILVDLQKAQDLMPNKIAAKDNGRASKWVAAMVMAKIYLTQKKWQLARDKSLEIINSGVYRLLPNFADIFSPTNEYNAESMWELDFAKDVNSQYEKGVPTAAGNGNWTASIFAPRLLDEPKNSADKNALIAALAAKGEAFNGTGAQVPSPDLVEKFPKNDLRRAATIQQTYDGIVLNFPYMPKNWNLNIANSPRFNHSDNKMIYRLGDVYLMAAEAENELNGPTNAYQYIHTIRKRGYATQAEWELKGLSQTQFRQAIYDERKWELAGESHRRLDLIRWGILVDVVKNAKFKVYTPAINIKPFHVLLPIPPQELLLNPNLLKSDPTNNGYR
jgi:starch-binding outer membrane protein, SusD/RagB family